MIIPYHSSGVNIVVICLLTEDSCACVFVDKLLGFPFCQADPLKTAGEETEAFVFNNTQNYGHL